MEKSTLRVSRRVFLKGTAAVLATPISTNPVLAAADSQAVTYVSFGGTFQEIEQKYVTVPFAEETGIKVNVVPAPDLAKIKAQQLTGNVEWDVYEVDGPLIASGSKQGFWAQLDLTKFDVGDMIVPPSSDSVPYCAAATGIAWDPEKYGPGKHPTNFTEYFDLTKFPGRRTLRNSPMGTLELALLADGVKPEEMYPLDLDRAFGILSRVKHSIVFTATTPQTVSLLQNGEVDFSYTYSNRVKASCEPGGGKPLAFSADQNIVVGYRMTILKGAPNKANALKLVAYFSRPEVQAREHDRTGLLPASKKAFTLLTPEARKWLPDMNNPHNLIVSDEYWANNLETLVERYKLWMMS
ncbi:extracellular solute-binding protein [Bradyrhizobium sp. CCBAU 11361]|uniref:extracellular solute-binding protein n=1 Tax=Bradyrhizobium sp. CCBAU 11361 TaxID=1630812 RepID=UPI00230204B3|nr:extracellular solute-binding protein [Bradyrhizobium sp. CCBAU 11361]MDA9489637.1 hypothetical protein [Bradyrhizobium sp. CCBAU 11361]